MIAASISFSTLGSLTGGRFGTFDVPCPICGPDRRAPVNRKRRVLRVWNDGKGFETYHCVRCGMRGHARSDGASVIDHGKLVRLKQEAAERDNAHAERRLAKAKALWSHGKPAVDSLAETYLREARRYLGPLPPTIRFLEPFKPEHHPAMIAAFGLFNEAESSLLSVGDEELRGVHLTLLASTGSGKAGTDRDKIMVGPSNGWPIVLAAMNDLLGLIVCEGIESGLSLHEATGCGVWVAGSSSRLGALADAIPDHADCVTVAADEDEAGKAGAVKLAQRLGSRGIHVEVSLPDVRRAAA